MQETIHEQNEALLDLIQYVITIRRENTNEWMMGLMDAVNKALDHTPETDRVIYYVQKGCMRILKKEM